MNKLIWIAGCLALGAPSVCAQQAERPAQLKTGKERLGAKWTDEQRVDDCKVPPDKRSRPRPTTCPNAPNS